MTLPDRSLAGFLSVGEKDRGVALLWVGVPTIAALMLAATARRQRRQGSDASEVPTGGVIEGVSAAAAATTSEGGRPRASARVFAGIGGLVACVVMGASHRCCDRPIRRGPWDGMADHTATDQPPWGTKLGTKSRTSDRERCPALAPTTDS